jgi:hypothetical protein
MLSRPLAKGTIERCSTRPYAQGLAIYGNRGLSNAHAMSSVQRSCSLLTILGLDARAGDDHLSHALQAACLGSKHGIIESTMLWHIILCFVVFVVHNGTGMAFLGRTPYILVKGRAAVKKA